MEGLQEFGMAKFKTKYSDGRECLYLCPIHLYGVHSISSLLKCSLINEKQAQELEKAPQPKKGHVISWCHKKIQLPHNELSIPRVQDALSAGNWFANLVQTNPAGGPVRDWNLMGICALLILYTIYIFYIILMIQIYPEK